MYFYYMFQLGKLENQLMEIYKIIISIQTQLQV